MRIIQPCLNLIPDTVELQEMEELFHALGGEYVEVQEAFKEFRNQWDDGKKREHLAEEVIDLITVCLTFLKAMEKMDGIPEDFTEAVMSKVFFKNYARGYHSVGWEGDDEND